MTKMWRVLLVLLAAVLVSCGGGDESFEVVIGDTFTVGAGQTAVLTAEDLRIKFDDVLEDSRCPTNVQCAWTGQARPLVIVYYSENESTSLEFNDNPAPGMTAEQFTVQGYLIQMESLDPYPDDVDNPIDDEDYRLTLTVTKAED